MREPLDAGDRWKIFHGDTLLLLPELEADTFDAVITDPPYSSGGQFRGDRTALTKTKYTTEIDYGDFYGDTRDSRGFLAWASLWLAECWRVTRAGGVIATFIDWRMLPTMTDAVQAGGWTWRGVVPWRKMSCRRMTGRFPHECEYVVWGSKGGLDEDRGVDANLPGFVQHLPVHHLSRTHLTEKPVEVMQQINRITIPGAHILDPFAGAGSTGVAAILDGRSFTGIELSAEYARMAGERIRAEEDNTTRQATIAGQLGLFAGAALEDDFG